MIRVVVIGAINWDINLFVKAFPRPGEEVVVEKVTCVPGGKAGNVAVAAARLLGASQVAIIGGLGRDRIAEDQLAIFKAEGVDTSGIKIYDGVESGQAYIVVEESGQNIIHTFHGANLRVAPEDLLEPERLSLIEKARILTVMDPPLETVEKMVLLGRDMGKLVIWDPGVRSRYGMDRLRSILASLDYLVVNEIEAESLTGSSDPDISGRLLSKLNDSMRIIVKLGASGCVMIHGDEKVTVRGIPVEDLGMKVVNTVGCGDAFLGAFAAARSEGLRDEEALVWANWSGALKATRYETRGSPSKEELEKYLRLWA